MHNNFAAAWCLLHQEGDRNHDGAGECGPTTVLHATEEALTDRLLNAATEVFLEKGFSAATIDEMAVRAKAGKITFYNHFGNKENLFEAIILRVDAVEQTSEHGQRSPSGAEAREFVPGLRHS